MSETIENVIGFYFCTILMEKKMQSRKLKVWAYVHVCNCEECLLIQTTDSVEVDDKQMTDQPPETEKPVLSGDQRKCIENQLLQLRASLLNTTSLLSPDHGTGFFSNIVKQIVENCETVFTTEDVLQKTDVLDPILAQNIINIVEMEANPDILV